MAFGLGVSVSALLSVRRCFFTVWLYVCVIRAGGGTESIFRCWSCCLLNPGALESCGQETSLSSTTFLAEVPRFLKVADSVTYSEGSCSPAYPNVGADATAAAAATPLACPWPSVLVFLHRSLLLLMLELMLL